MSLDSNALSEVIWEQLTAGTVICFDELFRLHQNGSPTDATTTVDSAWISEALAGKTGEEPGKTRMDLAFLARRWRSELLENRSTAIPGVTRMRLVPGETRVTPPSGRERAKICAGPLTLSACVARSEDAQAARFLSTEMEPNLANAISKLHRPVIYSVFPRQDFFTETVEYHFESRGWDVRTVDEAAEAAAAVATVPVSLVLCDLRVEGSQELARAIKSDPMAGPVSFVTVQSVVDQRTPIKGCRLRGDVVLDEPFEISELLAACSDELSRGDRRGSDVRSMLRLELETTPAAVDDACELLCEMFGSSGIDEEGLVGISAAYREALANAMRHGNGGIPEKKIEVRYTLSSDTITVTVSDQGAGFDYHARVGLSRDPDAMDKIRERVKKGQLGGLGITLMQRCVDDVEYSTRGNSVTLVKRI